SSYLVLIITQGKQGFRRVRLEFLRILQSTFRCISPSGGTIEPAKVDIGVLARKPGPGHRKIGVKLHRPFIKTDGFLCKVEMEGEVPYFKSQAAQICIVSLRIACRFDC